MELKPAQTEQPAQTELKRISMKRNETDSMKRNFHSFQINETTQEQINRILSRKTRARARARQDNHKIRVYTMNRHVKNATR